MILYYVALQKVMWHEIVLCDIEVRLLHRQLQPSIYFCT